MRILLAGLTFFFSSFLIWGQSGPIELYNPSFEGIPQCCNPPFGWRDCGFLEETPPDVQPSGAFEVTRPPYDGRTYLGMVTRDNDTWERVGQKLTQSMAGDQCYEFSLFLCRSPKYLSPTKANQDVLEPYTEPIVLRIWGGNSICDKQEMLGESPMIENTYWKKYNFRFEPNSRYSHIILEAFYKTPTIFPYNGNVLIDNASEIIPVDCDKPTLPPIQDLEDLTVEEEPAEEVVINQAPPQRTIIPQEEPAKQPEVVEEKEEPKPNTFQPKILKELSRTDFKEGETIRINHLYFKADSSIIQPESFDVLDEVYHFLQTNPSYVVEIGGHTNSRPAPEFCFELSTARAREVAEYLNSKGIPWKRLRIKGYGKTKLIANDATAIGRQRNQRVEIKILSLTG